MPKCGAAQALIELKDPKIINYLKKIVKKEGSNECYESLLNTKN